MELGPSPACKFKFRVARCGELRQAGVCPKPTGGQCSANATQGPRIVMPATALQCGKMGSESA
jgi:hypothetical protein